MNRNYSNSESRRDDTFYDFNVSNGNSASSSSSSSVQSTVSYHDVTPHHGNGHRHDQRRLGNHDNRYYDSTDNRRSSSMGVNELDAREVGEARRRNDSSHGGHHSSKVNSARQKTSRTDEVGEKTRGHDSSSRGNGHSSKVNSAKQTTSWVGEVHQKRRGNSSSRSPRVNSAQQKTSSVDVQSAGVVLRPRYSLGTYW